MEESSSGDSDSKISYKIDDDSTNCGTSSESSVTSSESEKENTNQNECLKQRIESLKTTMDFLRKQLIEEKAMWKQEVEEVIKNKSQVRQLIEADSEKVAADTDTFSISGYEQQLTKYQEALQYAQMDKKISLQRQIAISNYKRRLLEVENMCNLELLRVKQSVQFLQPLQSMLTEWNTSILPEAKQLHDTEKTEISMPLELVGNKFQTNLHDVLKYQPKSHTNASMPQLSSSSTIWQADDNVMTHSQSTIWYAECKTKFNAF